MEKIPISSHGFKFLQEELKGLKMKKGLKLSR